MKTKVCLRRLRSPIGAGIILFRHGDPNQWRTYLLVSFRPRQRRVLLRLAGLLVGFAWWPPRFLTEAGLRAEMS